MATKTNKSYTKRIKITKNGKLKTRKVGQDHFNAKSSGSKRMSKKASQNLGVSLKKIKRFVPHN